MSAFASVADASKNLVLICAGLGLIGSIVGGAFWGVNDVLAQIDSIATTQQQQETNTTAIKKQGRAIKSIEETVSVIDRAQDKLIDNQNTMWEKQQATDAKIDQILKAVAPPPS